MVGGIVARETEAWKQSRMPMAMTTAAPTTTTFSALDADNMTAAIAAEEIDEEEIAYKIQIATTVGFITGLSQVC